MARNHREEDVLSLVAHADGRAIEPAPERVPGLAEEHALILCPPDISPLRLFLTGWVYWASSSSMRALAANQALGLRPPALQVKDRTGDWVTVIDDLGLPSGIGRTLVADLTGKFLSDDRSVRIVSNLRVCWDQAFFASDDEPAPIQVRSMKIASSDLHYHGFSTPLLEKGRPDSYDYGRLMDEAPWNGVPGRYTRFGEVTELLESADNRLVVMAPGDELTLAFDPAALPPPPSGFRRDFVLHMAGWAKDNDRNTVTGGSVEPLPFLGRPADDAGYPKRYQTRALPALIPPLAPLRSR